MPKEDEDKGCAASQRPARRSERELAISCMINTEVSLVLAVMRRPLDHASPQFLPTEEPPESPLIQSLKALRSFLFAPNDDWAFVDPTLFLSPFLDVIQADDVAAPATGTALSAVLKVLRMEIFDGRTPTAAEAMKAVVEAVANCRLERTDAGLEDAVLVRIQQVLLACVRCKAGTLLDDRVVCVAFNTCFQVVQQATGRGDLLHRQARHAMHELVQVIFMRLPELEGTDDDREDLDSQCEDSSSSSHPSSGYGIACMVDIFYFLCTLLNLVDSSDGEMSGGGFDEDMQLFILILINSAIELGGEGIGKHPRLLKIVQDDLLHHLIHYGPRSSPIVLSIICSTVLNLYHHLRCSLKLQLEAFFVHVLLRIIASNVKFAPSFQKQQQQEVAIEGLISFCRLPQFAMEMYTNFDCDPMCQNVFEQIGNLLCKHAFPVNSPMTSLQVQSLEGLVVIIQNITDCVLDEQSNEEDNIPVEITSYKTLWTVQCDDYEDSQKWVKFLRERKWFKKKLAIAGDHFNRDQKKGMYFLRANHLVPEEPDPQSVGHFLRYTMGLDKTLIGDFLGDPDEFNIQVLKELTSTFDFSSVILDIALRTYLETFRLPGESQKIQRILEAFAEKFYSDQETEMFADKDAVFVLCYSLIMLNTDQHNAQVKKKMTEEEFIRNNRCINAGNDLPREYLSELYHSIGNNEITLSSTNDHVSPEKVPSKWTTLTKTSISKMEPYAIWKGGPQLGREMFAAISGPSIAAISASFEHADDEEIIRICIEGFSAIAKMANYRLEDALDELLTSLCKFTTLLSPYTSVEDTIYAFADDPKPRVAVITVFAIANQYGNSIRSGWRNIVECLLKLNKLKLLPQSIVDNHNDEDEEGENEGTQGNSAANFGKSEAGVIFPSHLHHVLSRRNSGLMGRFTQFLSLDTCAEDMRTSQVGNEFERNLQVIQQCSIDTIFTRSGSLNIDSLENLAKALVIAAGRAQKYSSTLSEEEDAVSLCIELLVAISFNCFVEKTLLGLLRICRRIMAQRPEKLAEELIFRSIQFTWKLDAGKILETGCEPFVRMVSRILIQNAESIHTHVGWRSALSLLSLSARNHEVFEEGADTLVGLMEGGVHITKVNFLMCVDTAFGFAASKLCPPEKSMKLLDLMAASVTPLVAWARAGFSDPGSGSGTGSSASGASGDEGMVRGGAIGMFMKLADALRKITLVRREEIRNHAVSTLCRAIIEADEGLFFSPQACLQCFNTVVFAMVDDLLEKATEKKFMEGTVEMAMEVLVEVFLRLVERMGTVSGFRTFWLGVLRRMDTGMKADVGGGSVRE
ncbi:ARF guanine-nucleotide exchange factor GNL2, partial [Amborella trichopoda]|uniref:ARF guanine-nucleotide exchange factor GNL2 n=1 Tax=Amborella trichopoda TaxID=13333 RepID=UPI0009BD906C